MVNQSKNPAHQYVEIDPQELKKSNKLEEYLTEQCPYDKLLKEFEEFNTRLEEKQISDVSHYHNRVQNPVGPKKNATKTSHQLETRNNTNYSNTINIGKNNASISSSSSNLNKVTSSLNYGQNR